MPCLFLVVISFRCFWASFPQRYRSCFTHTSHQHIQARPVFSVDCTGSYWSSTRFVKPALILPSNKPLYLLLVLKRIITLKQIMDTIMTNWNQVMFWFAQMMCYYVYISLFAWQTEWCGGKSRPYNIWYDWSNNHCVCWLQIKEMKNSLVKMLVSNVLHCHIK